VDKSVSVNGKVDLQKNRLVTAKAIADAKALADKNDLKSARDLVEKYAPPSSSPSLLFFPSPPFPPP